MPLPTHCPKCQAPFPESLERFGANTACKRCGQVLRLPDLPPPEEPPEAPIEEEVPEISREVPGPRLLPPIDWLMIDAWRLFRGRMGLCIGVFLTSLILRLALIAPELYGNQALQNQQLQTSTQVLIALGVAITVVIRIGVFVWLDIGMHVILLNIVRGQSTGFKDLLSGRPFFWRALLGTVFFEIAVGLGLFLGILPGVLFALVFWPFLYVLIDTNAPGLSCFPIAAALTHGNKAAILWVFAISFVICVFGFLSLIIGAFIALPYVQLLFALAYESIAHGLPDRDDE